MALSPCQSACEPEGRVRDRAGSFAISMHALGARFRFVSDNRELLQVVADAYEGLPQHRWPAAPELLVEMHLLPRMRARAEPPPLRTQEISGALSGVIDASNYVLVMPDLRRALIVVSEDMLAYAQHLRQELIEFAVFVLAARSQGLVPLHAACFGVAGRGVLLLGNSGAGKSTLVLQALLQGMEVLSEDAVFVKPENMLATGVANFLHLRTDTSHFSDDENVRHWIHRSPVIHRNSGVCKFELDLRCGPGRLAPAPLRLHAAVFISDEPATHAQPLLLPLRTAEAEALLLRTDQSYASTQPHWRSFVEGLKRLRAFRLRRGDPADAVSLLRRLLD